MTRSSDWVGQLGCTVVAGLLLFGLYLIVQSDRETLRARHAAAVIAGKDAARLGLDAGANPYDASFDGRQHSAWLEGYVEEFKRRRAGS